MYRFFARPALAPLSNRPARLALAFEGRRVEMASCRIFQYSILNAVQRVARGKRALMNHRILRWIDIPVAAVSVACPTQIRPNIIFVQLYVGAPAIMPS